MLRRKLLRARLCLLFTPSMCPQNPWRTLRAAVEAGVDFVQVREKEVTSRELLALTLEVKRLVKGRALIVVNDRADIAVLADVDGVHLGQNDLPLEAARRILGPSKLIGISTHSRAQARAAWEQGTDCIGFGPIFPTATKGYEKGLGPGAIHGVEKDALGPVFLIGGIRPQRLAKIRGSHRLAVSSAILSAKDPADVVRRLLDGR